MATLIRLLEEEPGWDREGRKVPEVKVFALRALGRVGDERAVAPLVALLADPDKQIAATIALGRIGDERAIPALLDILGDHDEFVALLKVPTRRQLIRHPIAATRAMFEDHEENLRGKALSSLASLRAAEVVPLVAKLLSHEHVWIRNWAAELATRIGDSTLSPALEAAERRTPPLQRRRLRKARRRLGRAS